MGWSASRRATLAALLGAVGCLDRTEYVSFPALSSEDKSWAMAWSGGGSTDYAVGEVGEGVAWRFDPNPLRLELRTFERSLSDLGLPRGRLPQLGGTAPLPMGRQRLVSALHTETTTSWTSGAQPLLDALRVPARSRCHEFYVENSTLSTTEAIRWGVSLGGEAALFGTSGGAVFLVRAALPPESLSYTGTTAPNGATAVRDELGGLWFADREGRLMSAELRPGAVHLTPVIGRSGKAIHAIHGSSSQLFAITPDGEILERTGAAWTTVTQLEGQNRNDSVYVARVGPDALLAAARGTATVLYHDANGDRLLGNFPDGVGVIAPLSHERFALGVAHDRLSYFEAGELHAWEGAKIYGDIKAFAQLGDGFLYTGLRGFLGEYVPDEGFCPVAAGPVSPGYLYFILAAGPDEFVLVGEGSARGTGLTRVTLRAPPG